MLVKFMHSESCSEWTEEIKYDKIASVFEAMNDGCLSYEILCPKCKSDMEYLDDKKYYSCTKCFTDVAQDGTILE